MVVFVVVFQTLETPSKTLACTTLDIVDNMGSVGVAWCAAQVATEPEVLAVKRFLLPLLPQRMYIVLEVRIDFY